jgi:Helix-turn-helix domain
MSALRGGLNRSTQHFILKGKMECGDGSGISPTICDGGEEGVMGNGGEDQLWDRCSESLKAIGPAFGKPSSAIYFWWLRVVGFVLPSGGAPGWLALTLEEREVISRGITAHQSARSIAKLLGRSPSRVSREMNRNGGYNRYRATVADENAWARARRQKYFKLATNLRLRQAVARKLR